MLKFKFLLWGFTQLLKRQIKNNPDCARYVAGKSLVFQIRTASGIGRHYAIRDGAIRSSPGLALNPQFTLNFKDAAKGFAILSAKDSQAAFLRGLGSRDLSISGDFQEVMWFQGLTAFLQPPKVVSPYDRTAF
ncbi:helicase [Variovorax sp. J31P207]|uniref:helicase n=1 Tax=Variovorax sp. J31P207 TaxID=3053510 RepID=UPI0025769D23|nr:helicase [Variovorax sp. J31P207]MDM0066861.1 helicase [Variovorax sp. J31P207]